MDGFRAYRKKATQDLRPYVLGEDMAGISVSSADAQAGSANYELAEPA